MKIILAAALISLSAMPAMAVDWVQVAGDEYKEYYVDNDSIQTNGIDYVYNTKVIDNIKRRVNLGTTKMNCSNATITGLRFASFTINGNLISQSVFSPHEQIADPIKEGTAPEMIYQQLCN